MKYWVPLSEPADPEPRSASAFLTVPKRKENKILADESICFSFVCLFVFFGVFGADPFRAVVKANQLNNGVTAPLHLFRLGVPC